MNKLLTLGIASLAVTGAVFVGTNGVSALAGNGQSNGHQSASKGYGYQRSLDSRAEALGLTADELKTALKTKTMLEIAQEKGITQEQFQAKMSEAAQARWQERQADCDGTGENQGQGGNGYGRNRAE